MANTIDAVTLNGEDWQDVSELTGIIPGKAVVIQNMSPGVIYLAISPVKPSKGFHGNVIDKDLRFPGYVTAGETNIWLFGRGLVSIQEG